MLVVGLLACGLALPAAADGKSYTFGERKLRPGSQGHDVRVLQDFLTRVGLVTTVDGRYGPFTYRRVRSWERRADRRVNGRMGLRDSRKLRRQVEQGVIVHRPRPDGPPEGSANSSPADKAVLGSDGRAIAPSSAPVEVKAVIDAANRIAGKPYKYGGGHGRWEDSGYDCSGAMSYALHGGGFIDRPMTSGEFASWGKAGKGEWITTYGHSGHSFMVVAGLRFDTGWNNAGKGPRWSEEMRPSDGYSVRHPSGV